MFFSISNYTSQSIPLKITSIILKGLCKTAGGKQSLTNFEDRVSLGRVFLDSAHSVRQLLSDTSIIDIKANESKSFFFYYAFPRLNCGLDYLRISYIDPLTGEGKKFEHEFLLPAFRVALTESKLILSLNTALPLTNTPPSTFPFCVLCIVSVTS